MLILHCTYIYLFVNCTFASLHASVSGEHVCTILLHQGSMIHPVQFLSLINRIAILHWEAISVPEVKEQFSAKFLKLNYIKGGSGSAENSFL